MSVELQVPAADEADDAASKRQLIGIGAVAQGILDDLRERRHYRKWASRAAGIVLFVFVVAVAIVLGIVLDQRAFTFPAVALVATLVAATTLLVVAFLRATFSAEKIVANSSGFELPPNVEAARSIVDQVVEQVTPKP